VSIPDEDLVSTHTDDALHDVFVVCGAVEDDHVARGRAAPVECGFVREGEKQSERILRDDDPISVEERGLHRRAIDSKGFEQSHPDE
jgi:hypothetical protein